MPDNEPWDPPDDPPNDLLDALYHWDPILDKYVVEQAPQPINPIQPDNWVIGQGHYVNVVGAAQPMYFGNPGNPQPPPNEPNPEGNNDHKYWINIIKKAKGAEKELIQKQYKKWLNQELAKHAPQNQINNPQFNPLDQPLHKFINAHIEKAQPPIEEPEEDDMRVQNLKKYPQEQICHRRINLTPFKLPYDDLGEIQLRLKNTLSCFNGIPLIVTDIRETKDHDFKLRLVDDEESYTELYSRIKDIRSPEPGYLSYENQVCFFTRKASNGGQERNDHRDFNQGITRWNAKVFPINKKNPLPEIDLDCLVRGFKYRANHPWSPSVEDMLKSRVFTSIRLSNNIAAVLEKKTIKLAYKNRYLGILGPGGTVEIDKDDHRPWILADIQAANLKVA